MTDREHEKLIIHKVTNDLIAERDKEFPDQLYELPFNYWFDKLVATKVAILELQRKYLYLETDRDNALVLVEKLKGRLKFDEILLRLELLLARGEESK